MAEEARQTDPLAEKEAWGKYFTYLINSLEDSDAASRARAVQILGEMREARAVTHLSGALYDPDPKVRQSAATALKHIGAPAIESLIASLNAPDSEVRQSAVAALGQIGTTPAIQALISLLRNPDDPMRSQAAFALAKVGPAAVEPLINALSDSDANVRFNAARILGQIGDAHALPALERVAETDRGMARGTAPLSLVNIADAARQAIDKIRSRQGTGGLGAR